MDKKILIFGANGQLGKGATEKLLSSASYTEVYLFDFNFEVSTSDQKINIIKILDLSIEENVISAFSKVKVNKSDALFLFSTIGGYYGGTSVWETEVSDFERIINLNLKANFLIAKHFSRLAKQCLGGSACFTSAYTAQNPEKLKFIYGASKAALDYLVKSLSLEGREINLSINAISPFIIDTPSNREWIKNADYSLWMKPSEIGSLVNSIFENYNFISGNIIELKTRFNK